MHENMRHKPNRTTPRYFKTCDAARIAREVVRDDPETTPEEVLACIARGFGFTHISLSRLRTVESGLSIGKIPIKTTLTLLQKLLNELIKKSDLLKKLIGPILPILKRAIELANKVDTLEPPQAEVGDVINPDKCKCKDQPTKEELTHGNEKLSSTEKKSKSTRN